MHNGNLCNTKELEEQLNGWFHLNTESDSEILLAVLIDELSKEQRQFGSLNAYLGGLLLEVLGGEYRVVGPALSKCPPP